MSDQYFLELWTDQLTDIVVPHIMSGFRNLYKDAKRINPTMTLKLFQKMLERIPDLSQNKLDEDYRSLLKKGTKHEELKKIIRVIFATSARVFLINQGTRKQIKIKEKDLQIPDNVTFIHKCYIESARIIWPCPFLYSDKYPSIEIQKNYNQAEDKIREAIKKVLRKLIPYEQIQYRYLDDEISSHHFNNGLNKALEEDTPLLDLNLTNAEDNMSEASAEPEPESGGLEQALKDDNIFDVLTDEDEEEEPEETIKPNIEDDDDEDVSESEIEVKVDREEKSQLSSQWSFGSDDLLSIQSNPELEPPDKFRIKLDLEDLERDVITCPPYISLEKGKVTTLSQLDADEASDSDSNEEESGSDDESDNEKEEEEKDDDNEADDNDKEADDKEEADDEKEGSENEDKEGSENEKETDEKEEEDENADGKESNNEGEESNNEGEESNNEGKESNNEGKESNNEASERSKGEASEREASEREASHEASEREASERSKEVIRESSEREDGNSERQEASQSEASSPKPKRKRARRLSMESTLDLGRSPKPIRKTGAYSYLQDQTNRSSLDDEDDSVIEVDVDSSEESDEMTRRSNFQRRPRVRSRMVSSKIRDLGLNSSRYGAEF